MATVGGGTSQKRLRSGPIPAFRDRGCSWNSNYQARLHKLGANMTSLERLIYQIVAAVIAIVLWSSVLYHRGYRNGETDRIAYYEPILRKAAEDTISANQRAALADRRADQINDDLETEHAQAQQALLDRATAAESRISSLLRQQRSNSSVRCEQVSPVPGPSGVGTGTSQIDPRDDRLAVSLAAVGSACEHDADALARWQEWYSRQRQALTQP